MATNIPPHNLGELVDAVSVLIHNPEATVFNFPISYLLLCRMRDIKIDPGSKSINFHQLLFLIVKRL